MVRPPWGVTLGAVAVAILAALPLDLLVVQAVSAGWTRVGQLVFRPLVGTLLVNTALITATATVAASVLGVAVAWCIERTDLTGRRIWGVLAGLPITVPAFVTSYSWVSLTPVVQDYGGALLIVTLAYYPLVYLPVAAVLRGMDPALEESARSLGLGPGRTFLRVVLPHTRPALLGGALVVAVHLLAEFGAFSMLRFRTFTTAIYDEYRLSFDGPGASMLATVLVSLCIVLLLLELQLRGKAQYARIGPGTVRPVHRIKLGRAAPAVVLGLIALIGSAVGLPLATLGYWLLRGGSAALQLGPLITAAATSLAFALGAAALTILLALPVAVLAVRYPGRLNVVAEHECVHVFSRANGCKRAGDPSHPLADGLSRPTRSRGTCPSRRRAGHGGTRTESRPHKSIRRAWRSRHGAWRTRSTRVRPWRQSVAVVHRTC